MRHVRTCGCVFVWPELTCPIKRPQIPISCCGMDTVQNQSFKKKKKDSSVLRLSSLPRFMISAEPQEEGSRKEHRISSSPGFMDWRYQSSFYTCSWCILMISKMAQSNWEIVNLYWQRCISKSEDVYCILLSELFGNIPHGKVPAATCGMCQC